MMMPRMRMRLAGLALPMLFVAAMIAAPFSTPVSVSAQSSDAMATEQVYVRQGPSSADPILASLEAGDWVTLTGYSENGFHEVYWGDWVAYVYADYLSVGGAVADPVDDAPAVSASGAVGVDYTADSVNLRAGASTNDGVIAVVPAGTEVYRTGNVANGFVEVDSGYGWGWIYADYLGGSPAPAPEAAPAAPAGNGGIVGFAMQFQGYPYVWAGNTPSGFDCSGFTQYVVQNVLGYDITHSADIQAGYGTPVGWGEWAPGDLVFFTGTGASGYYSHVGIYIGDGNMIHAENPGTGVVISSLYSDYYSSHYATAVRL
jgi:cell wall-associated NlpC family hydrolase